MQTTVVLYKQHQGLQSSSGVDTNSVQEGYILLPSILLLQGAEQALELVIECLPSFQRGALLAHHTECLVLKQKQAEQQQ